jgi:hypothetical protein
LEQAEEPVAVKVLGVPAQQKAAYRKRIRLNIWVSFVRFCLFSLYNNDAVASAKATQMPEPFNPDLFVAKWYCSKVLPEDMPQFAADALEAGYDGLALRRLAGLMRPTSRDVGDLFERVLREIGTVRVQSKEQALIFLSRLTAMDIVERRIEPLRGAEILANYAMALEYPYFIAEFVQLADMPCWGEYAPNRQKLAQDIIDEARLLLASIPG